MYRFHFGHLHTHYSIGYSLTSPHEWIKKTPSKNIGFSEWKNFEILAILKNMEKNIFFSSEFFFIYKNKRIYISIYPKNLDGIIDLFCFSHLYHFQKNKVFRNLSVFRYKDFFKNFILIIHRKNLPSRIIDIVTSIFKRSGILFYIGTEKFFSKNVKGEKEIYLPHFFSFNIPSRILILHHDLIKGHSTFYFKRVLEQKKIFNIETVDFIPHCLKTLKALFTSNFEKNYKFTKVNIYIYQYEYWEEKDYEIVKGKVTKGDFNAFFLNKVKRATTKNIGSKKIPIPDTYRFIMTDTLILPISKCPNFSRKKIHF